MATTVTSTSNTQCHFSCSVLRDHTECMDMKEVAKIHYTSDQVSFGECQSLHVTSWRVLVIHETLQHPGVQRGDQQQDLVYDFQLESQLWPLWEDSHFPDLLEITT